MSEPTQSKYLEYLPSIFQRQLLSDPKEGTFLGRFLLPFETVFAEFEKLLGSIDRYFAPAFAPESDFLPWLATWIALVLDEDWDEDKRRRLLSEAMELYRWRGTVYGMKRYLEIVTGLEPDDIEIREGRWPAGMQIGVASRIGFLTKAGANNAASKTYNLCHQHPQTELPPSQRQPNIRRRNDLVDFIDPPSAEIEAVAHDYLHIATIMPTDLPSGSDPSVVPATEPFQIIYRADTIEMIELQQDCVTEPGVNKAGVRLRYRPRAPDTYPAGTYIGGTALIDEMQQPYCFIVTIPSNVSNPESVTGQQALAKYLGKIRLILDSEKPAHTRYYLRLADAARKSGPLFMQIGIHSSIGLDTTMS